MSEMWVTFQDGAYDSGRPVTRADALRAAADQLTLLAMGNPAIVGGTLFHEGERIVLDLAATGTA